MVYQCSFYILESSGIEMKDSVEHKCVELLNKIMKKPKLYVTL